MTERLLEEWRKEQPDEYVPIEEYCGAQEFFEWLRENGYEIVAKRQEPKDKQGWYRE